MQFDGIIFDCDGTLADTMPTHYEAWLATIERYQLAMSEDRFYALGGWPTVRVAELLVRESGRPLDATTIAHEKETLFNTMIDRVSAIAPVISVVRKHQDRIPLAVATGATRDVCHRILRAIGIEACFRTVVSCEDVTRHKPAPDIFLEAARRLGVAPERCRVYEDTDPGLEAARRAGMHAIDVRTLHTPRRVTA